MKEISLEMQRQEKMLAWPIFDVAKGGNKMFLFRVTTAEQEGGDSAGKSLVWKTGASTRRSQDMVVEPRP